MGLESFVLYLGLWHDFEVLKYLGLEFTAKPLSCHVVLLVLYVAFYLSFWSIF